MANMFSSKIGRRGRKVINHPVRATAMNFTEEFSEMYDNFSQDWQARARALRMRKEAELNLKYQ